MRFWFHVRLAGAVIIIVGALTSSIGLSIIGLGIHYWGMTGAIDSLSRIFNQLLDEKAEEKENK